MILYHGTSERNLDSILKNGLLANINHSNWEHSNEYENPKGFVYLGYTPFHFSANSCYDGSRGVVLEVEIEDLNTLYPDAHHMVFKNGAPPPGITKDAAHGMVMQNKSLMTESLEACAGVCHLGDITADAIKRIVTIDWSARKSMSDLYLQELVMLRQPRKLKLVEYVLNDELWKKMPPNFFKTGIEVLLLEKREVSGITLNLLGEQLELNLIGN